MVWLHAKLLGLETCFQKRGIKMHNKIKRINIITVVVILLLTINIWPCMAKGSLIQNLSAKRDNVGGIIISGKIKLPKKTKIWIELPNGGQAETYVSDNGNFEGGPFTNKGRIYSAGNYKIMITSHFTRYWQSSDILTQVGEGGKLLESSTLIPEDPEFPKGGRYLKESMSVPFPGLEQDQIAIDKVKNAILIVKGKGRSADSIKDVVEYFRSNGGFSPIKWSAKSDKSGAWIVTLDCIDGRQNKQAQWEYDTNLNKVKYLDPLAKLLSWTPSK